MILMDSSFYPMPESSVNSIIARKHLRAATGRVSLESHLHTCSTLKVPAEIRNLIRRPHPQLKRKVRAAWQTSLRTQAAERHLKKSLQATGACQLEERESSMGPVEGSVEIVAIGPRQTIYEDALRQIVQDREKP